MTVKAAKTKTVLSPKAIRAAKAFSNAKRAETAAKDRKARAEAILREALGDAGIGTTPDGLNIVEVMESSTSKYSKEILLTRFPEAAKASYVKTDYTYLKAV